MERSEFEKIIGKSSKKQIFIASFILIFGVFIVWLILSGVDPESDDIGVAGMTVLWVLAGICILIGAWINYKAIKAIAEVKSGNHPILKAIDENDRGFVIWAYEHITKAQGGVSDHYIYIFTNKGKQINISVKKKRVAGILEFLRREFPQAIIGWSEEQEKKFNEIQKTLKKV